MSMLGGSPNTGRPLIIPITGRERLTTRASARERSYPEAFALRREPGQGELFIQQNLLPLQVNFVRAERSSRLSGYAVKPC